MMAAVSITANAGGMEGPVAEVVVVIVDPPAPTEPVYSGGYGAETAVRPDTAFPPPTEGCSPDCETALTLGDPVGRGSDRDGTGHEHRISQAPDGRVLCFTVYAERRGAAGPFDLCTP